MAHSPTRPPRRRPPKDTELQDLIKTFIPSQRSSETTGGQSLGLRRSPPLSPESGPRQIKPLRPLRNRPRRFVPESSSRRFVRGGF